MKRKHKNSGSVRAAALCLLGFLLLGTLFGCGGDETPPGTDSGTGGTQPEAGLLLAESGVSQYVIVRSDSAEQRVVDAAISLREAIREATGVSLRIYNDMEEPAEYEIIVGETNREAGGTVFSQLAYNDYAVTVSGNSLVLVGGNPGKTCEAVDRFIRDWLSAPAESLFFPLSASITERVDYSVSAVKLCGVDLREYCIVRADDAVWSERYEIDRLRAFLEERFGIHLEVRTDTEPARDREIVVGKTDRPGGAGLDALLADCGEQDGTVWFDGTRVYLSGNTTAGVRNAVRKFRDDYLGVPATDTLTVSDSSQVVQMSGSEYTVMSYNILCYVADDQARINAVLDKIHGQSPDLLGVQECSSDWYEALCQGLCDEYGVVGEMNDPDGQKWRNAIFYRKDRFRLLETKTQWLSATPSTVSRVTGSNQFRILTYAVLEDLETGQRITHCNTHMDYEAVAKEMQFSILVRLVSQLEGPLVLTGDFNTTSDTSYYAKIQDAGYRSAFDMTANHDDSPTLDNDMIDFCFVSQDSVNVLEHDVLDRDENGIMASDHRAVLVRLTLWS